MADATADFRKSMVERVSARTGALMETCPSEKGKTELVDR